MATNPHNLTALEVRDQEEFAQLLKNAPLAELADYLGVSIDEARNRRLAAMIENNTNKLEITVHPIKQQGNLCGFASVNIGGVRVDDFKILESREGGVFVGMPSKSDKSSKTGYRNTVFVDEDIRDRFNEAIIIAYLTEVDKEQTRPAMDKPPRMANQVAKAAKDAGRHNATLSAKEKTGYNRNDR